jgi:hypothetical protein
MGRTQRDHQGKDRRRLGIDAYDTGSRMGVAAMATMASSRTRQHIRAAYERCRHG